MYTFKTYHGWVPNIGGRACSPDKVGSKIRVINTECRNEYVFSFDHDRSVTKITARHASRGTVEINILDDGGVCSLCIKHAKISVNADVERVWIGEVWKEFRRILDGCSNTVADCTAMFPICVDPFPDLPSRDAPPPSIHKEIAVKFIETIERDTDAGNHIIYPIINNAKIKTLEDWKSLWDKSKELYNRTRSNRLYFERFMEIYWVVFVPEEADNLHKMMDARYEKASIIYDDSMRKTEFGYKKVADEIGRRRFYVACASLVLAAMAFLLYTL
ncbi:MAG: hypothetical protein LBE48_04665 [Methanomassiliicoccaceae archaeon]|jgi:hypothetical protein|nr:hypothetical protein [Methanomassiliicoccaceae archaeon]